MAQNAKTLLQSRWYETIRGLAGLAAVAVWRARWYGTDRIPSSGPVVLVSNHQSLLDPALIGIASRRHLNYLARDTLFVGWFGKLVRSLNSIPVSREGGGMTGLKESFRRLRRGEALLVFPEGTRTEDGSLGTFHGGFTALAKRTRASILPLAIAGAHDAWPRRRMLPRPGRVVLQFGRLMESQSIVLLDQSDLVSRVATEIQRCHELARIRRRRLCRFP